MLLKKKKKVQITYSVIHLGFLMVRFLIKECVLYFCSKASEIPANDDVFDCDD